MGLTGCGLRLGGAALLSLALAGCVADTGGAPASGGRPDLTIVPAPGGLDIAGSGGREIGFGRDRAGVLDSVARIEGVAPRAVPCGTGRTAVATQGAIRLVFERGAFVGWDNVSDRAGRGCA